MISRIISYLLRKPQFINLYVLELDYETIAKLLPPAIELNLTEVTATGNADTQALAAFHFYGHSQTDIWGYLADGQQCYVAKCKGQVISCYWRKSGFYYDYYLKRRIDLDDNEEYLLGFFTLPEFRGKGIFPYLLEVTSRERVQNCPKLQAIIFIRINNTTSLRSVHKLGFKIVGRIGFVEILGIRFHFLFGRDALPKMTKRFYFSIF